MTPLRRPLAAKLLPVQLQVAKLLPVQLQVGTCDAGLDCKSGLPGFGERGLELGFLDLVVDAGGPFRNGSVGEGGQIACAFEVIGDLAPDLQVD